MLNRQKLASGEEVVRCEKQGIRSQGEVRIRRPCSGVLVFRYSGFVSVELAPAVIAAVSQELSTSSSVDLFFDTEEMTAYDPEFRAETTRATESQHALINRIHVLMKSKVLALAVTMVNMATGGKSKIYSTPREFRDAIDAAVRARA